MLAGKCAAPLMLSILVAFTPIVSAPVFSASRSSEAPFTPEVTFLAREPVIDGVLDAGLRSLPVRRFSVVERSGQDTVVPATYRLAYGTRFFHVYLEAAAESLSFRDRAYQNGDGFVLVLGRARRQDEPTNEFYALACSAVNPTELE